LSYAEVRYAKTGISVSGGSSPEIVSSAVHDNSVTGISGVGGSAEIRGNTLSSNPNGIVLSGTGNPEVAENTIEDCTGYGISRTLGGSTGQVSIHDNVIERCGSLSKASINVFAEAALTGVTLAGNTITDGGGRAIDYYTSQSGIVPPDIDENTITGNASDAVWVAGKLTQSTTWEDRGFVIVPRGGYDLKIASGASLTLGPGLVLKPFGSSAQIRVEGELIAEGTASDPITITSIKDDSIGGDTNADGSATQPAAGDYVGFYFMGGTASRAPGRGALDYVHARYGGYGGPCACTTGPMFSFGGPVTGGPTSVPSTIRNSVFEQSHQSAVSGNHLSQITNSTFASNGAAISISAPSNPQITGNALSGNGSGIVVYGTGSPEIAENTIENCTGEGFSDGYGISRTLGGNGTGQVSIHDNLIDGCGNSSNASVYVYAAEFNSVLTGVTLADNTITNGGGRAIDYYTNSNDDIVPPDIDENTITGNASDAVWVAGKLTQSTTWEDRGFVIVFQGGYDFAIAQGATLTLGPGLVSKFSGHEAKLFVAGELIAEGTESEPITFTSIKDDSIGGDTNADGAATLPAPGDWRGIVYDNASGAELSFTAFHFAKGAVDVQYLSSMSIFDSDFVHNEAAIKVAQTAKNDPELAALSCVPPYLSFIDAHDVWFGDGGLPSPHIDISEVVGAVLPEEYGPLFAEGLSLAELVAPQYPAGDTIPFSIYSCPALGIPPTPVTPVLVIGFPTQPWFPWAGP
jgi:parallel beta-helix repeat protein